ncbi:DUF2800 domain-containing protein [Candidatus Liberibacter brunswickensis]|uniref:DUF2800 domain-containing protein n=1 Tax=Candidatus Liberibacter brunswickensis TaxID=1968796 RepID=UPI002FE0B078
MANTHAVLSPSSAHRWSKCSASIAMEAKCPETTSSFAQEGTIAHRLLEECLERDVDAMTLKGQKRYIDDRTFEVNDEMVHAVQLCLNYVRSFNGHITRETTFSLEAVTGEKDGQGTVDIVIDCGDVWHIVDFKYGAGVNVEASNNYQLILYGLGVLNAWGDFLGEPQKVVLTIIQPRIREQDPIKTWTLTPSELREWQQFFFTTGQEALKTKKLRTIPYTAYQPNTDVCRFCRAKARCPAVAKTVLIALEQPSKLLNNDELAKVLDTLPLVESYVKAVKDEAFKALNNGETLPNYTLKEGRKGNRTYKNEQEAEHILRRLFGDQAIKSVLISPAEADKLAKSKNLNIQDIEELQNAVIRPEGKMQITREQEELKQQADLAEFSKVA